jgi:hypothetical protein
MVPEIIQNNALNRRTQLMLDSNRLPFRILCVFGILLLSAICLGLSIIFARKKGSP